MATEACGACRWRNTVVTSVATNAHYFRHAAEMARSAVTYGVSDCVCVVLSSAVAAASDVAVVRELRLPWSSTWRPPTTWCSQKLSGWRHAGILKTHALHHLSGHGWDILFVDTDWRFVANPLPAITALGRDIVAARDQTRHMLNVGVLWIRYTRATLDVAWRTMNRTLVAWDQAVFTEEAGASSASCCWTDTGRHLVHPAVSREAKLRLRGGQQECAAAGSATHSAALVLPPPASVQSRRMYPRWSSRMYNSLPMSFYRWKCYECDNKCTATFCALDGSNATAPLPRSRGPPASAAAQSPPSVAARGTRPSPAQPRPRAGGGASSVLARLSLRRRSSLEAQAKQAQGQGLRKQGGATVKSARCTTAGAGCCARHPRALGCPRSGQWI